MRIDYSSPKQSYVSAQNKPNARKEPNSLLRPVVVVIALTCFLTGYGTGWFFSQRSAKKAYQAAIEQNSLESSAKQQAVVQTAPQPQQPPQQDAGQQPGQAPVGAPQPALSFYKTLPNGQKSDVIGSGINSAEDKTKARTQSNNLVSPAAKPATAEKPASKPQQPQQAGGFTVQVASFSLKSEAEATMTKLSSKGYNVSIVESNQGEKGIWYRVRVGKKLSHEAAKELAGKLGKTAMVIPD